MSKVKTTEALGAEDTVQIGDKVYNIKDITPSVYFEYVKGLKQKVEFNEYEVVIDTVLNMLKKTKLTGQTAMAKELTTNLEKLLKELEAVKNGFNIFILRKDLEKYIDKVEACSIKIIELSRYEREIPDEIIDKVELANNIFDELYIVFTDYTEKATKKVAKERRDKDPILFGAFKEKDKEKIYIQDRLFFIADWVEENCDLTLDELVRAAKKNLKKNITYKITNPTDEQEVRKLLESYKQSEDKLEEKIPTVETVSE